MKKKSKNRTKSDTKQTKKKNSLIPFSDEQARTQLKKNAMLKALINRLGVVSLACQDAGVSRSTFYEWVKTDPYFRQQVEEIPEIVLDFAESSLYKQISEKNTPATIFFLKTKGKGRGYVEKEEASVDDGETKNRINDALDFLAKLADGYPKRN